MRRLARPELVDALVAAGFVLAAAAEAAVRHHAAPGQLVFGVSGALWLGALVLRRRRPVLTLAVIAVGGTIGSVVTSVRWPEASDDAGVWIVALLLACYSLGAHAAGRVLVLGVLLPAGVVLSADLTTRSGWSRISGILFVSLLIGLLPTAIGRLVRVRRERLETLREQREQIVRARRAERERAVLSERLRATARWRATLVEGLRSLAATADPIDPGGIEARTGQVETRARALLARTREEVVALTAPVEAGASATAGEVLEVPVRDHVANLREAAQPWSVLSAGAVVAGLVAETRTLETVHAGWVLPVAALVGLPLALVWRRPVLAVTLSWLAMTLFSRAVAPLDGTLSDAAFALAATFAVAVLSRRRGAVVGLAVCLAGQLVGVGADAGEGVLLLLVWLGGLAVNDATGLVEQSRANIETLARQEDADRARAVVEERLRLAREVHDAVGHSLTVVALQAGAARRMIGSDPERAREVMRTVASVARSGVAALALEPDADLETLLERVRGTGIEVEADIHGEASLGADQWQVAVRVVQEALTNVLRHAPGASARVVLHRDEGGSLVILVTNAEPTGAGTGPGGGRGLAGMRDRVTEAGGEVRWGPRVDGGFEVTARLPLRRTAPAASVTAS